MASLSNIKPVLSNAASASTRQNYSIQARGKSEAEIFLYGDVGDGWFGGVTAAQFAADLSAVGKVDKIDIRIDSAGGDVFQGLAIYRLLVDHPARVVAHIDGLAASIASVIAMAATEINISEAGMMMIHNAWGVAVGGEDKMTTMAALLRKMSASIRDIYVARTGNNGDAVKKWMDAETWFSGSDAVANGFADAVAGNLRIAARVDGQLFPYQNVPPTLVARPNIEAFRERINLMKAKFQGATAA